MSRINSLWWAAAVLAAQEWTRWRKTCIIVWLKSITHCKTRLSKVLKRGLAYLRAKSLTWKRSKRKDRSQKRETGWLAKITVQTENESLQPSLQTVPSITALKTVPLYNIKISLLIIKWCRMVISKRIHRKRLIQWIRSQRVISILIKWYILSLSHSKTSRTLRSVQALLHWKIWR